MAAKNKAPISLRIRLKYPDEDTFVASYAPNISRGGIFIQSRTPQPEGTSLRFELVIKDNTRLIRGEGYVVWVKEYDASQPAQPYGMGVRFTSLDEESQRLVERVIRFKEGSSGGAPAPSVRSQTQEFRSIADEVAIADAEEPQAQRTAATGETLSAQRLEPPPVMVSPPRTPRPPQGDGVPQICVWADEQLQELIDTAPLPLDAAEAALHHAIENAPSVEDLDGLEDLLAPVTLPALDPAAAREELRLMLGAPDVPRVAPLAAEPSPAREAYSPAAEQEQREAVVATPPPEPAPEADQRAAEPEPRVPSDDTSEVLAVSSDSCFEEFSPIGETPEPALLEEQEAPDLAFTTHEPGRPTPVDTRKLEMDEETAVAAAPEEMTGETLVSALAPPLGGREHPDLDEPSPLVAEDVYEQDTSIDRPVDEGDLELGIIQTQDSTLAQEPWHAAGEEQPVDENLTDVVEGWEEQQRELQPDFRYDEINLGTDPDGSLDDSMVDLGDPRDFRGPGPELLEDELAHDPDLNNEVFEALAGVRDLAVAPPAASPERSRMMPGTEQGEAPSLELLATHARVGTPVEEVAPLEESDAAEEELNVVVDDEEDGDGAKEVKKPAVRAQKSGLFRRLFGRKDS